MNQGPEYERSKPGPHRRQPLEIRPDRKGSRSDKVDRGQESNRRRVNNDGMEEKTEESPARAAADATIGDVTLLVASPPLLLPSMMLRCSLSLVRQSPPAFLLVQRFCPTSFIYDWPLIVHFSSSSAQTVFECDPSDHHCFSISTQQLNINRRLRGRTLTDTRTCSACRLRKAISLYPSIRVKWVSVVRLGVTDSSPDALAPEHEPLDDREKAFNWSHTMTRSDSSPSKAAMWETVGQLQPTALVVNINPCTDYCSTSIRSNAGGFQASTSLL